LIVLKRYGLPLSPKAVVWFLFGGNDLSDVDIYESRRANLDGFLAPPPLESRTFTRNALTALARLTTPVRREPSSTARRHQLTFTDAGGRREIIYLDANENPWQPRQWDVISKTLLDARAAAAGIGADLLVVYIPRKIRVYQGLVEAAPDSVIHRWKPNDFPQVLAAFLEEHGVPFLDSTVPLRQAVAAGESVYLPDDVHWNAAGHRVVAAAVAERLRRIGKVVTVDAGARK
jgi:hypothetical protein